MSNIYTSADQLIGKTPLLELTHIEKETGAKARILAKLEYLNPAGSVKDRIAKAMIDEAEASGKLKPGSTIIEPIGFLCCYYSQSEEKRQVWACFKSVLNFTPADRWPHRLLLSSCLTSFSLDSILSIACSIWGRRV